MPSQRKHIFKKLDTIIGRVSFLILAGLVVFFYIVPGIKAITAQDRTAGNMPSIEIEQNTPVCMPLKEMHQYLITERHMGYAATAILKQHKTVQLYVSNKTGHWIMIDVSRRLQSCVIMEGYEWGWALPKKAVMQ